MGVRSRLAVTAVIVGALGFASCAEHFDGSSPEAVGAESAIAWFNQLYSLVQKEKLSPPEAARFYGYAAVAQYEAVAPGTSGYQSLAGQLNGLGHLPAPLADVDFAAAASSAVAAVARGLLSSASRAAIDAQEASVEAQRASAGIPVRVLDHSHEYGTAVGQAILAWAAEDGFKANTKCAYVPPTGPGLWVPTPPANAPALQACWGRLRPMALASLESCAPPRAPAFSTDPGSQLYLEALEVFETVNNATPEQRTIAGFWADGPGQTGTPAGHWISIVGQIAGERNFTLERASEAYARVGIAVVDAFISCWAAKYQNNLLRPITYIRAVFAPDWTPLLDTPPFPEYTSGHSVQSAASAEVLTDMLGVVAFTDTTANIRGFTPRSFASFEAASQEAALSRLYAGIHYRSAIERGAEQGHCVGRQVVQRVHFRRP